ncbi:hypothetical protein ACE2AK_16670 [Rahnella perminowiae]|uniref:Uncharacterized protein n=1 Tax=Rahnella perminowiae TaxID=2816244 RepID=A0ABS6L1M4_9GAMM|nr:MULTISPECIES: hypothetical protein [Rahnella]MBU9835623.1 hypothetical protein [Rahnella perminowiae]MCR9001918.1 hypothetical protein [Rahnella perminowiae]UJD88990.1 hypothetical protein FS594_09385 [Rahnella aquatilis]
MPSITLYTSASHRLDAGVFAEFSTTLTRLAKEILKAKENNIHISYLTAEIGFGTPVYFEAKLRQEVFRTVPVLDEFMHQVDLLIKEKTGVTARIRCFSFEAGNIYAKN